MKILRSVTRRGFSVDSAGWFTVLRPARWFAASRLPDGFRYLHGQSEGNAAPEQKAPDHADNQETVIPLHIMESSTQDHYLMRSALIILAAAVLTSVLLWWMIRGKL
jgi:hypothetical protein